MGPPLLWTVKSNRYIPDLGACGSTLDKGGKGGTKLLIQILFDFFVHLLSKGVQTNGKPTGPHARRTDAVYRHTDREHAQKVALVAGQTTTPTATASTNLGFILYSPHLDLQ